MKSNYLYNSGYTNGYSFFFLKKIIFLICLHSPVDPAGSLFRLDVDVIMVDVHLGDLHLEVIGQQANRLPHRTQAGPAWWLEEGGRGRRAWKKQTLILFR